MPINLAVSSNKYSNLSNVFSAPTLPSNISCKDWSLRLSVMADIAKKPIAARKVSQ